MYLYGCTYSHRPADPPNTPQFQAVDLQLLCYKGSLSSDILSNARQPDQNFVENYGSRVQQGSRLTFVAEKRRCFGFLIKADWIHHCTVVQLRSLEVIDLLIVLIDLLYKTLLNENNQTDTNPVPNLSI